MKFLSKTIFVLLIIILSSFSFFVLLKRSLKVLVNRNYYHSGDSMVVTVKNNFLDKEFCFSSCYPYFLEKRTGGWKQYGYQNCSKIDRVSICVAPQETKKFETKLPEGVSPGSHRIAIPVCHDCNLGTVFFEEGRFFSNDFHVQ